MGFFHWLCIARPLKVMSIVSFSFVNWILSVVIDRSLAYCLLRVLCLLDPLYLCLCRISLRQKVCGPTGWHSAAARAGEENFKKQRSRAKRSVATACSAAV